MKKDLTMIIAKEMTAQLASVINYMDILLQPKLQVEAAEVSPLKIKAERLTMFGMRKTLRMHQ